MEPKVEYSHLPSEETSLDGLPEDMEKAGFLGGRPKKLSREILSSPWLSLGALSTIVPWVLVVALSIALLRVTFAPKHLGGDDEWAQYTPVPKEAFEYHDVVFHRDFGPEARFFSEYSGWPNDETDRRWKALYEHGFSYIDSNSHDKLLNKTLRTPMPGKEDSYMVVLDVFHQLHCLNTIRRYFYPKRYNLTFFNDDGTVSYEKWIHVDHCIDTIRQSLMCNADTSANGYDWFPSIHYLRIHLNSVHRCRNWDMVRDWAKEHYVPYNGRMAHVNEETGRLEDFGTEADLDPTKVTIINPPDFRYTKDDM
ncbi:hypothetical protein GQ53DRAFT_818168 [Thozetella sp. PMI_491]|nr:hypothetical protein GQ53DRAFT_818168 [Thozetella sp. PMI_491]